MKKVRFQSPNKLYSKMNEFECHSPRPFLEQPFEATSPPYTYEGPKILPFTTNPLDRYEQSNSSPFTTVKRTELISIPETLSTCFPSNNSMPETLSRCLPSNELELSLLDGCNLEPRRPIFQNTVMNPDIQKLKELSSNTVQHNDRKAIPEQEVIGNYSNKKSLKDNSFFIKKDNLNNLMPLNYLQNKFKMISLEKENNPLVSKTEMMKEASRSVEQHHKVSNEFSTPVIQSPNSYVSNIENDGDCNCHHCVRVMQRRMVCVAKQPKEVLRHCDNLVQQYPDQNASLNPSNIHHVMLQTNQPNKNCTCDCNSQPVKPKNAVDKKSWAIERYERSNDSQNMEIEKQTNVSKEKREPTVADLFKIIKLQNEQLQLLQEKVDKFISTSNPPPISNNTSIQQTTKYPENVMNKVDTEHKKISIGVMTSFEVVCTSTVINKDVIKTDTAQIQCNRSQISFKEVVSKTPNLNFLEGIKPGDNYTETYRNNATVQCKNDTAHTGHIIEEKTLNEQSLFNVQVDNATTPLMSPDQTLYLDVRDYSDSDSGSENQSNVGWTYYNKVMTHVNGMLQDSDMPSSASALYRNMRQQCMQMQIDKTNVSVTKRVKFGEDVLITRPNHTNIPLSTDTSLKMNQLAAKYLKDCASSPFVIKQAAPKPTISNDMSLATKNYMERHHIIQGQGTAVKAPYPGEMPRFLDITALKQQPKFL